MRKPTHPTIGGSKLRTAAFALGILTTALSARAADVLFYVSDYANGSVYSYTTAGASSQATFATTASPYRLAIDISGNVYVGDYGDQAIYKFTPGGAQSTFATLAGMSPYGMAFDSSGDLYVAANAGSTGTILKITPLGVQTTFDTGFSYVDSIAFDSGGNMYASGYDITETYGQIWKYTPGSGNTESIFFSDSGFNPGGLATDVSGNLYVANGINTVFQFTPGAVQSVYANGFSAPTGLGFDGAGNLFVTEYASRISMIPPGGGSFAVYDNTGLGTPYDVAFAPIPEPSRALLALAGAGAAFLRRRRKGSK